MKRAFQRYGPVTLTAMLLGAGTVVVLNRDRPAPQQEIVSTSSMHGPTMRKLAFTFDTILRHPMEDGSRKAIPFADAKAGDRATFTVYRNGKKYLSDSVTLPQGPMTSFRVVAIFPEVDLEAKWRAELVRSSWHGKGVMPEYERTIRPNAVTLIAGEAIGEISGVRVYDPAKDEPDVKRRAVRH